jgi:hypothetical protein
MGRKEVDERGMVLILDKRQSPWLYNGKRGEIVAFIVLEL